MAKYNYDKKALKGLTPFPFLGEVKARNAAIEAAPATLPKSVFNANVLAKRLHPAVQHCLIEKVEDHGDAKSFTLIPDRERGTEELARKHAAVSDPKEGEINNNIDYPMSLETIRRITDGIRSHLSEQRDARK